MLTVKLSTIYPKPQQVSQRVTLVTANWKANGEAVIVASRFNDLPAAICAQAKQAGYDNANPNDRIAGVTHRGKIYLVHDEILAYHLLRPTTFSSINSALSTPGRGLWPSRFAAVKFASPCMRSSKFITCLSCTLRVSATLQSNQMLRHFFVTARISFPPSFPFLTKLIHHRFLVFNRAQSAAFSYAVASPAPSRPVLVAGARSVRRHRRP